MRTKTILMVKKSPEYYPFDSLPEGTLFVKGVNSGEEIALGYWLVHDSEEKRYYVIEEGSGLMVTSATNRKDCREMFELIREKALSAREGKGYKEACDRLRDLCRQPTWNPKEESAEEYVYRLMLYKELWENDIR